MSVDKSLMPMPMPQGIGALDLEEEKIDPLTAEISILLADEDGEVEEPEEVRPAGFDANLAEEMDERDLLTLASDLLGDYEEDLVNRKEWFEIYTKGLQLLGLKYEDRAEPWIGACGVTHPLLMESAVKFQSETIMETFPASGPVKTVIIGKETPEKKDAAQRVADDMNHQLTEVMKEYRPEHERLLIALCLSGNAFKKIYYDPALQRQTAVFVPSEDIIVPYGASNLESAERVTHRMRKTKNEARKLMVAGFYRDLDLGEPMVIMDEVEKQRAKDQGFTATADERYQFLEMHVNVNLPGYEDVDEENYETGVALPYVVTIDKGTSQILAIRRNWREEDPLKKKRQHFAHYGYIPGFGFYYFGLIHLIGGHARSATSLLRQLVDAGTLSNLPGGLKARGLRIKGDDTPIAPGEFRDVDLPSGSIRDNILPLPYKEPSQTLSLLLDKIVEDGRRFAAVADLKVSDMSAQSPVGTTLAILERVLKVMSAVQARIHYTMKQEFKLLAEIIRDNTDDDYAYQPETGDKSAKQADYDLVDVLPVSDPNASTMSQRVVQYQAVLQLSQQAPQIYDLPFLHRQMIETLGVKNAAKIVPVDDDMQATDPVTENMNVMMGKPVKAFMHQDHEAHLTVHMAAMQDPKLAMIMAQNPQAQALQGAAMAHVMEHVAYQYRREIEKMLGASLPPMPEGNENILPPEIEAQLANLAAQAAAKLLQKDVAEVQAQQAAEQAQDPLVQMQMKDIEIKEKDQQRKAKKDLLDAAAKADELRIREKEVTGNLQIKGAQLGVSVAKDKEQGAAQRFTEGAKTGADLAKHASTISSEMRKERMRLESQEKQAKSRAQTPQKKD